MEILITFYFVVELSQRCAGSSYKIDIRITPRFIVVNFIKRVNSITASP